MKKFNLITFLLLTGVFSIQHLLAQNCATSTSYDYLNGNQVKTPFHPGGDMFWDFSDGQFLVPYDDNAPNDAVSTMFAAGLWMGGYDGGANLKIAAQTYRQGGSDYWPGPIDVGGTVTNSDCANFDRVWKVSGDIVFAHLEDLVDGNIDDPVHPRLLQWPGRGNPHFSGLFGFQLPNQDLAPFYDVDGDNIYDPEAGDYPVIDPSTPNVIANDLLWLVFNDVGNIHSETGGDQIGVEVQLTAFAFSCSEDTTLDRTIFTRHKIFNKSQTDLFNFQIGLWADFDIGCWDNDFVGAAPSLNTFYGYNGTATDPDCPDFAGIIKGYNDAPPAMAVTFLNNDLTSFVAYDNNPTVTGSPNIAGDYYGYLKGFWRDGSPIENGGDGYSQGTFPDPIMYNSRPLSTDLDAWSEVHENHSPGDRRGVGSVGTPRLNTKGAITVDIAYSLHYDLDKTNLENVDYLYDNIPIIQSFYDNNFSNANLGCLLTNPTATREILDTKFSISPNPASDVIRVSMEKGIAEIVQLFDVQGRLVYSEKKNAAEFEIAVGHLPKGIYLLNVGTNDAWRTEKICIIK